MEYYSTIKKECNWVSSNKVNETGGYYAEQSKPEIESPVEHINTYIWNLEKQ